MAAHLCGCPLRSGTPTQSIYSPPPGQPLRRWTRPVGSPWTSNGWFLSLLGFPPSLRLTQEARPGSARPSPHSFYSPLIRASALPRPLYLLGHGHVPMTRLAPVASYFVALTPPTGFRVCPPLTSLPRTESRSRPSHGLSPTPTPRLGGYAPPYGQPRRVTPNLQGLPALNSNVDSPSWGPPPQGDRQDRATLPQYHAAEAVHKALETRSWPSPSRQGPRQAPRGFRGQSTQQVPPCCPPPGDHWGSTPRAAHPSLQLRRHYLPGTPTQRDAAWTQVRRCAVAVHNSVHQVERRQPLNRLKHGVDRCQCWKVY